MGATSQNFYDAFICKTIKMTLNARINVFLCQYMESFVFLKLQEGGLYNLHGPSLNLPLTYNYKFITMHVQPGYI